MHVFVTGGTGTIGSPVVAELLAHSHSVLALARSDRSAQALEAAGADVLHLGQDDLPVRWAREVVGDDLVIGRSSHSPDETLVAADEPGGLRGDVVQDLGAGTLGQHAGLVVGHRHEHPVVVLAPEQPHVDAVVRAVVKLAKVLVHGTSTVPGPAARSHGASR